MSNETYLSDPFGSTGDNSCSFGRQIPTRIAGSLDSGRKDQTGEYQTEKKLRYATTCTQKSVHGGSKAVIELIFESCQDPRNAPVSNST